MTYLLDNLASALASGQITARRLVEDCLVAIDDPAGEGARTFIAVYHDRIRDQADAIDHARKKGWALPRYAGIPLSIKDLFDEAGVTTRAGSTILADAPPASADATVLARLKQAGFLVIGRTNMTEFAFSGLGTNVHYGDARSPFERDPHDPLIGRVAGGSSSGSAVSISDNMAPATIGSDTGGSTRVPAAFCSIVGLKPTTTRMPGAGVFPLSTSFDAAGPMANSVSCCAILDDIMAGGPGDDASAMPVKGLRLAMPKGYLFDDLDPHIASCFAAAIDRLSAAGASITDITIAAIEAVKPSNSKKSIVAAEAYQIHKSRLEAGEGEGYDPLIAFRLGGGKDILASDYIEMLHTRRAIWAEVHAAVDDFDALVLPTSPAIPPSLSSLVDIAAKTKINARCLRNTAMSNYLDRPTITIPCHPAGSAPAGLSLIAGQGQDRRLLAMAAGSEAIIRG